MYKRQGYEYIIDELLHTNYDALNKEQYYENIIATCLLYTSIPTARYETFDNEEEAAAYVKDQNTYPTVIKADGLALGKGVLIAGSEGEALEAIYSIMGDKIFGASGNRIVIEEFLEGPEVSVLSFTDGKTLAPMVSSKDHKRALDGDRGLNTGGMGTISPNQMCIRDRR